MHFAGSPPGWAAGCSRVAMQPREAEQRLMGGWLWPRELAAKKKRRNRKLLVAERPG